MYIYVVVWLFPLACKLVGQTPNKSQRLLYHHYNCLHSVGVEMVVLIQSRSQILGIILALVGVKNLLWYILDVVPWFQFNNLGIHENIGPASKMAKYQKIIQIYQLICGCRWCLPIFTVGWSFEWLEVLCEPWRESGQGVNIFLGWLPPHNAKHEQSHQPFTGFNVRESVSYHSHHRSP